MKKLLFFLLVFGAIQVKAQVTTESSATWEVIKDSFDIRDSTFIRIVPFVVKSETKPVKYDIKIYAKIGEITVSLTDPTEKISMNITIGNKNHSAGDEPSKGEISDDKPLKIPGTWKFSINSKNATGTISYQIETIKP
jgi:hypothetical protein